LLSAQSGDGAWRDFRLKPGRSEAWVTAYVGAKLLRVEPFLRNVDVWPALEAARDFVAGARHPRGGWAYNDRCDPDADSTARAILFLRAMNADVPLKDYATLARFQLDSGDFATYRAFEGRPGWCRGHPDVTVVALRAMSDVIPAGHSILRRGHARLSEHVRATRSTASYWWASPFYMARELLDLWHADERAPRFALPRLRLARDAGCFDTALALEVATLQAHRSERRRAVASERRRAVASELADRQSADGSWPCAPILRVTDPHSETHGDRRFRRSEIACDDRRLFTTATVIAALAPR
jgi:hypothetical protein